MQNGEPGSYPVLFTRYAAAKLKAPPAVRAAGSMSRMGPQRASNRPLIRPDWTARKWKILKGRSRAVRERHRSVDQKIPGWRPQNCRAMMPVAMGVVSWSNNRAVLSSIK